MKKLGFLIFAAALAVGLALASFTSFGSSVIRSPLSFVFGSKIVGSGNMITENRNIEDFKGVKVSGILSVEVTQSEKTSVVVEADDNIAQTIRTEVRNGVLSVWSDKKFKSENKVTVRVSSPSIESLETSGIAQINFESANVESLDLDSSGASNISVSGTAKSARLNMSGASNIQALKLNTESVRVNGSGASSAEISVSESINAHLSGASDLSYKGNPSEIEKHVSGGADLTKID